MARIRTIKPEFFTSEDIVSMTPHARLLYIALWCEADKRGRLAWKPRTFKMRWLPADDVVIDEICGELLSSGVVVLYGDGLAYIPGFEKHQHVNPRETESDLPDPSGYRDTGPKKVGKTLREAVFERDGHKCLRCGSDESLQVDHILPQSCGGPHILENLRTLCRSCNAARPVQGQKLDDDLKRDGFTVQQLRVKFGIDASIPDKHAQGGREGKGRKGTRVEDAELPPGFLDFWASWPKSERKGGKGECVEVWEKSRLEAEAAEIVNHVKAMSATEAWRKQAGQFIPAPVVYLRGRRWEGAEFSAANDDHSSVWAGAE